MAGTGPPWGQSPGNSAAGIAFDPSQPATVYLSTNGGGPLGGGFYISHDSGATWQPSGDRVRSLGGFLVAARPPQPGYPAAVFVGDNGLYVSTDHASTWARSDFGLNNGWVQWGVQDDGLKPPGLYASTGTNLFHTANGGRNWTRINNWDGYDSVGRVAVDLNAAARPVYAPSEDRVWKSTNAGGSWSDVTPPLAAGRMFHSIYSNPNGAGELFAITETAIFHSDDGGKTWSQPSCDVAEDAINNFLVARAAPGRLYLARNSGLWISDDNASTCAPATVQPLPGGHITSIAEAGTDAAALLVAGLQANYVPIVLRSTDAGASYLPTQLDTQFFPPSLSTSPDLKVAFAVDFGTWIRVSRDGGVTWTEQPDDLFDVSAGVAFLFSDAVQGVLERHQRSVVLGSLRDASLSSATRSRAPFLELAGCRHRSARVVDIGTNNRISGFTKDDGGPGIGRQVSDAVHGRNAAARVAARRALIGP